MIARRTPLKRSPIKRKAPRPRKDADPEYLAFLRRMPCCACFKMFFSRVGRWPVWSINYILAACEANQRLQTLPTESAHFGVRGLRQKAPDRQALPLCSTLHHREGHESAHVLGRSFFVYHNLDREALTKAFNDYYDSEKTA
jgi:hypothetical protein